MDILAVQAKAKQRRFKTLVKNNDISYVGVFGSTARGDQVEKSDIDFLIRFNPSSKRTLFSSAKLKNEFEAIFGSSVDLVNAKYLNHHL